MTKKRIIFTFHIELHGIDPPIWRRIAVKNDITMWDLHVAVQDAMGWKNCHLHGFYSKHPDSGIDVLIGIPDDEFGDGTTLAGWEVPMRQLFSEPGDMVEYAYDFGDNWQHTIRLEAIEPAEFKKRYPRCLGGERSCPPEDCGGPHGYALMLEALHDPTHPQHETYSEWFPRSFDPNRFDPKWVYFDDPRRILRSAFGNNPKF